MTRLPWELVQLKASLRQADEMHGRAKRGRGRHGRCPARRRFGCGRGVGGMPANAHFVTDTRSGTDRSRQRHPSLVRPL